MIESIRSFLFGLWIYFGLSMFEEVVLDAPEGKVKSALFHFADSTKQCAFAWNEGWSISGNCNSFYSTNSLTSVNR